MRNDVTYKNKGHLLTLFAYEHVNGNVGGYVGAHLQRLQLHHYKRKHQFKQFGWVNIIDNT